MKRVPTLVSIAILLIASLLAAYRHQWMQSMTVDRLVYLPTPQPLVAFPFTSTPDTTHGNVRYTGRVVFTGGRTNFSSAGVRTLYITNTGTAPLMVHPEDFRFGLLDRTQATTTAIFPAATPISATVIQVIEWHDTVQPGETVTEDFRVSPFTDMAV